MIDKIMTIGFIWLIASTPWAAYFITGDTAAIAGATIASIGAALATMGIWIGGN